MLYLISQFIDKVREVDGVGVRVVIPQVDSRCRERVLRVDAVLKVESATFVESTRMASTRHCYLHKKAPDGCGLFQF
jgi:hypothetical protein